ncbi:MAG: tRNA lysidine(34) synthetase TilS [Clostridiales bacterium]|nr:tRNA lysidine(34) synthetase TilS [Clostridiales bacterium]
MVQKVKDYIKQNNMIEKGDRIVLGVSGGADSVCLLYMLYKIYKEEDVSMVVVHVNHGIRGDEAKKDERFVAELCEELNVEYLSFTYPVPQIAEVENLSEEEAGRKVRYEAFFQVCKDKRCNKIAIAHNKNDIAETVLFNLFRGTGIRGMAGIAPTAKRRLDSGEVMIIRPLLCLERMEIEEYLQERNLSFQIDATNLLNVYTRNKIRNHIVAYASEEINQNAVANISNLASQLREIENYINGQVEQQYSILTSYTGDDTIALEVCGFQSHDIVIQKGIIRKIICTLAGRLKNLESKHVDQVLSLLTKQVGKQIDLPYCIVAVRDYDRILFHIGKGDGKGEREASEECSRVSIEISKPGKYYLPKLQKNLEINIINYEKKQTIPKSSCMKWFDYDKIENTVIIRNRNEGDYIQINASGGRKKLKDYFIDQKIPRDERDNILLVTDGSHIMWILDNGSRMSEKYKVDENTKQILLIKLIDTEDN